MVVFPDGRKVNYFVASGALAFDGKGWFWERPLVWLGLIKPELFTVVFKSLTLEPRTGNLRWWKPWDCVKLIKGGAVNKVGLTNKGFDWWMRKVAPKLDFSKGNYVISLFGTPEELFKMLQQLNTDRFKGLVAVELNVSCPNTGEDKDPTQKLIDTVKAARKKSHHCFILKIGADQDGVTLAKALVGVIQAMSFNTLAFEKVFPGKRTPLYRLEEYLKRRGLPGAGGGGGVSGKELQKHNWPFMKKIHKAVPEMQLIASSIMEYGDLDKVDVCGASAYSFGTIHLPYHKWWLKPWTIFTNPCKATKLVERHMRVIKLREILSNIG